MKSRPEKFRAGEYIAFALITALVLILCTCLGSVSVPVSETLRTFWELVSGNEISSAIIAEVRLPRVLCAGLAGAALSLCGASMQGLLRNPLADGSTLGVSSGAALGAVTAIAFGITVPELPFAGTVVLAAGAAFLSLVLIIALSYRLDGSLATNTIILVGVIFSMFASSLMSLIITFAGEKIREITFWTMGSLAMSSYENALLIFVSIAVFGTVLMMHSRELNAFALGEDNARNVGVDVKRVKLTVLICASALIGVCVAVGGSIGFVGLAVPHIARMIVGPNHRRLLPASAFSGAVFLMLADLVARTILSPKQLPIGVVTSLVGAVVFVYVFFRSRRSR